MVHGDGPIVKEKSRTYETLKGFGHHELVVTRSHKNNFPKLSPKDVIEVFEVFRERLRTLKKEKDVSYISIFHNWSARWREYSSSSLPDFGRADCPAFGGDFA